MADDLTQHTAPPGPLLSPDADTIPASTPPEGAEVPAAPAAPRYRLGVELGRGGMGRVVEAFDTQLGRTVALKEVLPGSSDGIGRRFHREVQITAMLEHASIVPLYDSGTMGDGRPFYVMRRVTGRPLEELIRPQRSFAERLAQLPHVLQAIDAVAHAHGRGVIHRDLKPSNILVGELGETVVIDWGLAKRLGERDLSDGGAPASAPADSLRTQAGAVFGTPGFMAPEQARGEELGTEGDVFALGVTLYQLLAGKRPIKGSSATEVLSSTVAYDIEPIAKACPQVPRELIAIVDKALAFDRGRRYRDAGELAADVRRFLTGQLVEAHRYTRVQRIARFVRRHKGALAAVTAVAIAGATTTGYFFRQVLAERDAATEATHRAEAGRREADQANAQLAERNDQLTVWRAESLLDTSPTAAAAALKQVRANSPRLADARAAAQAAAVRGVASAIAISRAPAVDDVLDPDARRLVHVTLDGRLDIYDLDLRRSVLAKQFGRGTRALWIGDGSQLLVATPGAPATIIDPSRGDVLPATLPEMSYAEISDDGETVLYTDAAHHVGLVDLRTRAAGPQGAEAVDEASLGPEGTWYATKTGTHVRVFDRTGKELAHRDGSTYQVFYVGPRRLVALDQDHLFLLTLDPTPVWKELPIHLGPREHMLFAMFAGDQLEVFTTERLLAQWNGHEIDAGTAVTPRIFPAAGGAALALGNDDRLYLRDAGGTSSIRLPPFGDEARIAARRGRSRIAVVSPGQILVVDLADVAPVRLAAGAGDLPHFVDDDHVLLSSSFGQPWRWLDLRTHRVTAERDDAIGMQQLLDIDPSSGRALKVSGLAPTRGFDLIVMHEDGTDDAVAHVDGAGMPPVAFDLAVLVPPDAVAFATDRRVMVARAHARPVQVGTLDSDVAAITIAGPHRFAVLSAHGELVRYDTTGAELGRAQLTPQGELCLGHDRDGRVLVGNDRELLRWDEALDGRDSLPAGSAAAGRRGVVEDLGRVELPIAGVRAVEGGIAVTLHDATVQLVAPGKPVRTILPAQATSPVIDADGTLAAGWVGADQIELVELPSLARWTLPVHDRDLATTIDLAPSARLLLQPGGAGLALWRLPRAGTDLGAWLSDRTNAAMTAQGLAWPWQLPGP